MIDAVNSSVRSDVSSLLDELAEIVGSEHASMEPTELARLARTTLPSGTKPAALVRPGCVCPYQTIRAPLE